MHDVIDGRGAVLKHERTLNKFLADKEQVCWLLIRDNFRAMCEDFRRKEYEEMAAVVFSPLRSFGLRTKPNRNDGVPIMGSVHLPL